MGDVAFPHAVPFHGRMSLRSLSCGSGNLETLAQDPAVPSDPLQSRVDHHMRDQFGAILHIAEAGDIEQLGMCFHHVLEIVDCTILAPTAVALSDLNENWAQVMELIRQCLINWLG